MSDENLEPSKEMPTKRTRTVKPKVEPVSKEDFEVLRNCISKLAVMCGQGNILGEFGLDRWVPSKEDTKRKFK